MRSAQLSKHSSFLIRSTWRNRFPAFLNTVTKACNKFSGLWSLPLQSKLIVVYTIEAIRPKSWPDYAFSRSYSFRAMHFDSLYDKIFKDYLVSIRILLHSTTFSLLESFMYTWKSFDSSPNLYCQELSSIFHQIFSILLMNVCFSLQSAERL